MAHASTSLTANVAQPGSSAAVASGGAPNSNPSSTPRPSHTHPLVNATRDGAEAQGTPAPNSGKFDWHGDKMLHVYMCDYLVKRNFTKAAQALASEANIRDDESPPLSAPQGLLFEWWVVLWDLFMAKTGEGNGGTQNAHLYLQAHKQKSLGPAQPHAPHGYPYTSPGYPSQAGPPPHILPPGHQSQPTPAQDRTAQQNGLHPNGHFAGQMAVAPASAGATPRPLVGQLNGSQPAQNSQSLPNSGHLVAPGPYPSQPSQVQGNVHGQIGWHQFPQGQSGMQGSTMQPTNSLASQQGHMLPGQMPVHSQMRAGPEFSQAQYQQHAPMLRQHSATSANGAPQQQPGPTAANGQPDRPLNAYPNSNATPNAPGGVNGNPVPPNPTSGPGQPPQVGPYPPQPYHPHAQQQPQAQHQNQPNPYPPAMLPPSFPHQPPQQSQANTQPQTPRTQPGGPQTPGLGSQHVASTPQQAPPDTPRSHPQQPQNFSFQSQQLAGAHPNGVSNPQMNPPFTPSSQHQQQQRPFDGQTNPNPGPAMRPGTSMLPPQQPVRVNAHMGMNARFHPPGLQPFGIQQPGAIGPVGYNGPNGPMGTGGVLPSGASGSIHHGTGAPMHHALNNFMASHPHPHPHQQQHTNTQVPPQPQSAPQSQPPSQSQSQTQLQPQFQAQNQPSASTPLPNGSAPNNTSRAPTPAQQQQVTNVQRSANSTPAPNGANLGSNNVSPARGTSIARTGSTISPQQSDAALQSLLPPGMHGRQPAQQQQAILQRGLLQGRPFNGPPGSFASGAGQHDVHAGMKRTGSPPNDAGDPSDGSPPDIKRPRRNSQGAADGSVPTISNNMAARLGAETGVQPTAASATQQILQLHQGARRPTHPATPNGMAMRSPQPGNIPPHSNALSEHASAQITAASATAAPNNRASGLNLASRPQQAVATRPGSPSPPLGNTQRVAMQPPVAPSPVNKDPGKPTGATVIPTADPSHLNPSRAPSSTPKLPERKPPTPTFPQPSNPSAPLARLASDSADGSSPSLSKPSPSTSGGGSTSTNNTINMQQANFNPMSYDNSIYMQDQFGNDQFGSVDFGMPDMFPESLRGDNNGFEEQRDMFMMDFENMIGNKPFDSSNNPYDSSNNDDYGTSNLLH